MCAVLCVVKGYLRKGASLVAIKEYSRAAEVYQKAIDLDANCQEAIDAYRTWVAILRQLYAEYSSREWC